MQFYRIPNSYSAQIEGAGLNLRIGDTCLGVAPPHSFWHRCVKDLPMWYRLLFPWSLSINAFVGCGQTHLFELRIGAFTIWYQDQGDRPVDRKTEIGRAEQKGLHASWHYNNWKLLF